MEVSGGLCEMGKASLYRHYDGCNSLLLLQAPGLLVLALGLYAVIALLYGVVTFSDRPEEGRALKRVSYTSRCLVQLSRGSHQLSL